MKKINPFLYFVTLCFALLLLNSCGKKQKPLPPLTYTGTEPRVQNPLSPEDSQLHVQVPEGFEAVLFAAEPNIINPIAFSWDERGRLWVVQSQDYPHGLNNDVGGDRITICEDTNGDGKADKFTDFATKQSLSTGIVIVKGGAIVAQAPNMVFLEDTDGDDKMDKSTILFGGFGTWDTHAGPSNLKYGIDNYLWGSVGYSGFKNTFQGKNISFDKGVFKFSRNGKYFEPVGKFNNNTWGVGFNENFEIFGSTANNNHACYVGIPLKHYEYLAKRPSWAINSDFIQGHYEITPADSVLPLQQVDVRGGYTAAAGANFYTARNYPEAYQNQMYVNEPTGHLVHIAKIVKDGAGYKEVDGGNIFASTDAWTAPVFSETGPDGNLWVADWYNPVIQHNPDKRGMENQIWNDDKGEGNAHINEHRDKGHGRIYIIKHEDGEESEISALDRQDQKQLLKALADDNLFWRTAAQRMIIEEQHTSLIPELIKLVQDQNNIDKTGLNAAALHALYTLDGLGALQNNTEAQKVALDALNNRSFAVQKAAISLLPNSSKGAEALSKSGLLTSKNLQLRLDAILKAGDLPETTEMFQAVANLKEKDTTANDKWLVAAAKLYAKTANVETVNPNEVEMVLPTAENNGSAWKYTFERPSKDWYNTNFNDAGWKTGKAIFGPKGEKRNKTIWPTKDIWLRKEFVLNESMENPVLKVAHDDDYEVLINGKLLLAQKGSSHSYKYIKLDPAQESLFKKGKNTIAVHCRDHGGNRLIDVGIGKIGALKADVVFDLNTVNQKMAFDKTTLYAKAGQIVQINLNNPDQMSHNLVVIKPNILADFGKMVDDYLKDPNAAKTGYVPNSRNVIATTKMLEPGDSDSIIFKLPNKPGRYPFVCTFPGHWSMMQGVIIVTNPGTYLSEDENAPNITVMGGGGSHNFQKFFGIADGKILHQGGKNNVTYTEDINALSDLMKKSKVTLLSNNKPINDDAKQTLFKRVNEGMSLLIYHPSTWYNWADWPKYNKELVSGGSRSHEKLQTFEVKITNPNHPLTKGVPAKFKIYDELYRWEKDPEGPEIEILAVGKGIKSGAEFPVLWVVKHPKAKIVANTLGHDERAHSHKAYQKILSNTIQWVQE